MAGATNAAQTSFAHYLDTVKAAIDTVLEEAATRGHRPTLTAIERHLGIPHATFHRHYADLIDTHFRPHIPATAEQPVTWPAPSGKPAALTVDGTGHRSRPQAGHLAAVGPVRRGHGGVPERQAHSAFT